MGNPGFPTARVKTTRNNAKQANANRVMLRIT
jgi:hypothetical protein